MSAPVTAMTATVTPASELRAGTAERPRPGSVAWPIPIATLGRRPARKLQSANVARRARRARLGRALVRGVARHAGTTATATINTTIATNPAASTNQSSARPGCGSAMRAGPIGIIGDAATAMTKARIAPATAASATCSSTTATMCARRIPSEADVALSVELRFTWRATIRPIVTMNVIATSSAKRASATAWGRIACSTCAAWAVSSEMNTPPWVVARNCGSSAIAHAWSPNADFDAPGASAT